MPSVSDIRHRIKTIQQTRQITNAMYLLSKSRIRKVLQSMEKNRAYSLRIQAAMKDILINSHDLEGTHPYLVHRPGSRVALIVVAGDKGLAGGYNGNVVKLARAFMQDKEVVRLWTIGAMSTAAFAGLGDVVDTGYQHYVQNPQLYQARRLAEDVVTGYDAGDFDEVHVIYTYYKSAAVQQASDFKLLPIELPDYDAIELEYTYPHDMLYEPSPARVFSTLVPQYLVGMIFGALVQSVASEHSARIAAMENATHNADEMIGKLTLQYNTARQFAITQEISEIVAAANALSGEEDSHA